MLLHLGFWKRTNVAIKRIKQRNGADSIKQSMTELYCLNSYRHENILPIVGYCIEGPYACLIYQYMLGGSLYSRIQIRYVPIIYFLNNFYCYWPVSFELNAMLITSPIFESLQKLK